MVDDYETGEDAYYVESEMDRMERKRRKQQEQQSRRSRRSQQHLDEVRRVHRDEHPLSASRGASRNRSHSQHSALMAAEEGSKSRGGQHSSRRRRKSFSSESDYHHGERGDHDRQHHHLYQSRSCRCSCEGDDGGDGDYAKFKVGKRRIKNTFVHTFCDFQSGAIMSYAGRILSNRSFHILYNTAPATYKETRGYIFNLFIVSSSEAATHPIGYCKLL
jgi:hypothetical protein